MKSFTLTPGEQRAMAALAIFGLLIPNGIFIYYFFSDPSLMKAAMTNPISLVFMTEAFFLMFLFAWLLKKVGSKRPTGLGFIILSLLGSMVFSVPTTLWLRAKNHGADPK